MSWADVSAQQPVVLDVRGLRTAFDTPAGPLVASDGIDVTVRRGETLGVVGESGSGKSVTARSIMRLLPRSGVASSGEVWVDGVDVMTLERRQLRRLWGPKMAMIFQDPLGALNPVMSVEAQVTEGMRRQLGVSRRRASEAAERLLASVGIDDPARRLREYPHQLSGGMRQRVVIAIALACDPQLLIADEPTTALDVTVQRQVLDLLSAAQRERNMALVLITHDLSVVAERADEVVVMYAGRIVERAPTATLLGGHVMPYTEALLASVPRVDHPSGTRYEAVGGRPPNLVDPPKGCRFAPRCRYAQQRCHDEEPELAEAAPGHLFRCFFPIERPVAVRAGAAR